MRRNTMWAPWLLLAWLALAPAAARAQNDGVSYAPGPVNVPLPYGSTRPEDGGFFVHTAVKLTSMSNPLKSQTVGISGFRDLDGSITGAPGTFVGSGSERLNVDQLTGKDNVLPGFEMGIGWKFRDGSAVTFNWTYIAQNHYRGGATLLPQNGAVGSNLENSFLYADVYNIPPEYSGPDLKLSQGNPGATFGIWNAASIMTIDFIQRFQQYEIVYREPIFETDTYRLSGLVGPRFAWIWERFRWRTTDYDITGAAGPLDVGVYTNVVSNRMYGAVGGCDQEYYLGRGLVLQWKLAGAMFVDSAKLRAKYELGDKFATPQSKRSKRDFAIVPEAETRIGLMWYPTEYVQIFAGYELQAFFNTLASRKPIDTDFANVDPHYSHTGRIFNNGILGIAFTF